MSERPHLLLIADLRHASPRWPVLAGGLIRLGWRVTVVTAPIGADGAESLGFPDAFASAATLVEVGGTGDVLDPVRRVLWLLGLRRGRSLTQQMKSTLDADGERRWFDRLFQGVLSVIAIPDLQRPWTAPAFGAAMDVVTRERVDVIVSSTPYPTSHVVASRVHAERPDIPWVADYRDLWSQNHNYVLPAWRRGVDRRMELRTIAGASAFTAVSPEQIDQLVALHGKAGTVVRNAFVDFEELPEVSRSRETFTLSYTGVRYAGHQDVETVINAIAALRDRGLIRPGGFRFDWVGPYDAAAAAQVVRLRLGDIVLQGDPVSRREATLLQRRSHALLFLQWDDPTFDLVSSLKFSEYLGSGRPILATGGGRGSPVAQVLAETGCGTVNVTQVEIESALAAMIDEFTRTGDVAWRGDPLAVAARGASRQVNLLDVALRAATARG